MSSAQNSSNYVAESSNLFAKIYEGVAFLAKTLNSVAGVTLALMVVLAFSDVVLRYIFHRPLKGTAELIEVMMTIIYSAPLAFAEIRKAHISIDFVIKRIPTKIAFVINTVTDIISTSAAIPIAFRIFAYGNMIRSRHIVTDTLRVPIYPFIYLMGLAWLAFALAKIINLIKVKRERGSQYWIGVLVGVAILCLCVLILLGRDSFLYISPERVGFIGWIVLLILTFSGMEMGFVLSSVAICGMLHIIGLMPTLGQIGSNPFHVVASYNLSVYPLFILMGTIVYLSGIGENLFGVANKWVGHVRGGLAMASVIASAIFGAVSGSGTANAATMSKISIPAMRKLKYNIKLAAGSVAAGGTIGVLIPPSTVFVLYGILTQTSIGKLFIAGILPGILKTVVYLIVINVLCKRNPDWGPRGPKVEWKEKFYSLRHMWSIILLFIMVIGGIYTGVFTPTEAAGVGAFGALICAVILRKMNPKKFVQSCIDTTKVSGSMGSILVGAYLLGFFLAVTRLPLQLSNYIVSLGINRFIILFFLIILFLICGSIMDILSVVVAIIPIVTPLMVQLGFDQVWFGVLVCWLFEIGALTPPIGINVFYVKATVPDIDLQDIFSGVMPFYIADMVAIVLLVAFPQIATFLPNLMG